MSGKNKALTYSLTLKRRKNRQRSQGNRRDIVDMNSGEHCISDNDTIVFSYKRKLRDIIVSMPQAWHEVVLVAVGVFRSGKRLFHQMPNPVEISFALLSDGNRVLHPIN